MNRLVKEVLASTNECFYTTVTNPLPREYFGSAHVFQCVSKEIQVCTPEVKTEVYSIITSRDTFSYQPFVFSGLIH